MGRPHGRRGQLLPLVPRLLPVILAACLAAGAARADALDRLLARVGDAAGRQLAAGELRLACGEDVVCAARRLAATWPAGIRLVGVDHPDTDSIRWVRTEPSISVVEDIDGYRWVRLDGFGRTVLQELDEALSARPLALDLSANAGGDFGRMLQVAGRLLGALPEALRVGGTAVDLAAAQPPAQVAWVRVTRRTASSAEMLAALLVAHGGARLCGEGPTSGKDYLNNVVAVDHDLRLLVRGPTVTVPGVDLAAGLVPQAGC